MPQTATRHLHVEPVMGTMVTFDVRDEDPHVQAVADAVARLHEVDAEFSTYRPDSAVCRFDRGELLRHDASADLRWIVDQCERLRQQTGGYFDAYATGHFDPSALVKGWAVQRAADALRAAGAERFCLNAGGDVATSGHPEPGRAWQVGIQHPLDPRAIARTVEADGGIAVATSGLYERGEHIVVPGSGRAPEGLLSVTVTGPDLGTADAYATAAFAMGADGPAWTLGLDGYQALSILADQTVLSTPDFPEAFR